MQVLSHRINPRNRGGQYPSLLDGLALLHAPDYRRQTVALGPDPALGPIGFSADGRWLSLVRLDLDGIALLWVDVRSGDVSVLSDARVNGTSIEINQPLAGWMAGTGKLWCRLVVDDAGAGEGERQSVPLVYDTGVDRRQLARFWRGSYTARDEALVVRYFTTQLAIVDPFTAAVSAIGEPGVFRQVRPSPDGRYLLVERAIPPYTRGTSLATIPARTEVWDVAARDMVWQSTLAEPQEMGSCRWLAAAPATLVWTVKARPGEAIVQVAAPFREPAHELFRTAGPCRRIAWTADGRWLTWERTSGRALQTIRVRDRLGRDAGVLWEDTRDTAPLAPIAADDSGDLVQQVAGAVVVTGEGGLSLQPRLFVDCIAADGERRRLFESAVDEYEDVLAVASDGTILTLAESASASPRHRLRVAGVGAAALELSAPEPPTCIARAPRHAVEYVPRHGKATTVMVHVPPGTPPEGGFPCLLWAYPCVDDLYNKHKALRLNGYAAYDRYWCHVLPLLSSGYAVVATAALRMDPSQGDPLGQLIHSATATVAALAETGQVDPKRVAIGGHCGGAWLGALLLAHTQLFCAGVLCSGFYNLTTQPAGWLLPNDKMWTAPEKFVALSPIFRADAIVAPTLIVQGSDDSGLRDLRREGQQFYAALAACGGTARLVSLPDEGHTVLRRESQAHLLSEIEQWCDRHVKGLAVTLAGE